MPDKQRIKELISSIESRLQATGRGFALIGSANSIVEAYLSAQTGNYADPSPGAIGGFRAIARSDDALSTSLHNQLVLLVMIDRHLEKITPALFIESVCQLYEEWFERIVTGLAAPGSDPGFYSIGNDMYLKDLGICSLKMFPAGAQIVETCEVYRTFMKSCGIGRMPQAFRFYFLEMRQRRKNYYQMHTDDRYLRPFNNQDWYLCYLRIAAMMERKPEIAGVYGSSWFFDPLVNKLSPRLGYLLEHPMAGGAGMFRLGSTPHDYENATRTSRSRRKLAESGDYVPTSYIVIWPREKLLAWAKYQYAKGIVTSADLLIDIHNFR